MLGKLGPVYLHGLSILKSLKPVIHVGRYLYALGRTQNSHVLYGSIPLIRVDDKLSRYDVKLVPLVTVKVIGAIPTLIDEYVAYLERIIEVNDVVSSPQFLLLPY